ncbi:MAG: hypothetical protein ACI9VI_001675 [Candidatus Azotimanducaceae bacterium]
MKSLVNNISLLLITCIGLLLLGSVAAQESRDGELGPSSYGELSLTLEITNRPNPTITLINRGGGSSAIPAFVAEKLLNALGDKNNANFPVCLAIPGNYEATVSITTSAEEQFLISGDGSKIPFTLKLNGNSSPNGNNGNGQSARYKPSDDLSCSEGSGLDVEINLGEPLPDNSNNARGNSRNLKSYRGSFKLLIRVE